MNKETTSEMEDDLRPEYDLAELLKGGVRGKYVARYRAGSNVVVLAPDVANEEVVNEALRLVMQVAQIPQFPSENERQATQGSSQE
jgi:hypothetical protein